MRSVRLDEEQKAQAAFSLETGVAVKLPSGRVMRPVHSKLGLTKVIVSGRIEKRVNEGA